MRIEIGPKPSMMRAMKSRSFAFQLPRPRGIPGALALGLIVVLVVGAVALLQVQQAVVLARVALGVEMLVIVVALAGIVWRVRWASTSTT